MECQPDHATDPCRRRFACSDGPLMPGVEAVEKVPYLQLRYSDEKIDLSVRAVFDDHAYGKDKSTPKYRAVFELGIFSTASLDANGRAV
jgi:hypothetical protein